MRDIAVFIGILIVLLTSGRPASAQSVGERPSWTFGFTGGGGKTWDDEGSIGRGWLAGGYLDRRITDSIGLELSGDLLRHERNTGPVSFQAEGYTTYLSAALTFRFGPSAANAFLLGGGTVGIHRGKAGLGDQPLRDADSTNPGFIFGGGVSFQAGDHVEIAPLIRMTLMQVDDDFDPFSSIVAGIRIGFTPR